MNALEKSVVLYEAARVVRSGWCQGSAGLNADGKQVNSGDPTAVSHCLASAIYVAVAQTPQAYAEVVEAIRKSLSCPTVEIDGKQEKKLITWNDMPGRTQEEVATLLETVAKELTCAAPSAAASASRV